MLRISDLTYRIGGNTILDGASVHIPAGHKVGVVGQNGAGKSTLLRLILGEISPDDGKITVRRQAKRVMVAQEAPGGNDTLIDTVLAADVERTRLLETAERMSDPALIADAHDRLTAIEAHSAPARAAAILAGLGFDEAAQQRRLGEFSGGWRMRVALAAALFLGPDLLLLDEPTNFLDLEGAIWLEGFLARYPRTIMIVSHDRDLLNRVAGAILHVSHGGLTLFRGNYDLFERQRTERLLLQRHVAKKQEAQRRHMQAFVDRFRYKATKARQAQSRLKKLARMDPPAVLLQDTHWQFGFPQPEDLRPPLISAERVEVGYDPGKPVLRGLTFRIDPGDRIALLGRNGNGKSTLAKLLSGRLEPMAGEINRQRKLSVGYFAQHQIEDLDPDRSAFQHMSERLPGTKNAHVRTRLGAFGLSQEKADLAASELSGGERARLVLALISAGAPELLVLDEPTNHLDVNARDALIQALNDYAGAVLMISHDRHLIDLVADELWLVSDHTVRRWEDDLDGYRARVTERRGQATGCGGGTPNRPRKSREIRRASRQAGAVARARLTPLRDAMQDAEARMKTIARELDAIGERLTRQDAYESGNSDLGALLKRQGELKRRLRDVEAEWLEAADRVEAAQAGSREN